VSEQGQVVARALLRETNVARALLRETNVARALLRETNVARASLRETEAFYFAPMKSRPRMPSTVRMW